jgi:hypothetical protein
LNELGKDLTLAIDHLNGNNTRASAFVLNELDLDPVKFSMFLNTFFKNVASSSRICLLDLDLYGDHSITFKSESLILISFRAFHKTIVTENQIIIGLDLEADNYLFCDMHMIYVMDKILSKVISSFKPSYVVCLSNSNLTQNQNYNKFVFSGDCKF